MDEQIKENEEKITNTEENLDELKKDLVKLAYQANIFDDGVIVAYSQLSIAGGRVDTTGAPGYYYFGKQKVKANTKYVIALKEKNILQTRTIFYTNNNPIHVNTTDGSIITTEEETLYGYKCRTFTPSRDGYIAYSGYVGRATVDLTGFHFYFGEYNKYIGYVSTDDMVREETFVLNLPNAPKWLEGKNGML